MTLSTWWTTDTLPPLRPLPGFTVAPSMDDDALARLNRLPLEEIRARRLAGHRPYVACLQGEPVGYGWVATREASIGELDLLFSLPLEDRYLWDFATLPEWQGRGLYPRLLQGILREEMDAADRFWIIHAPENLPSGAGMRKAGLLPVGELSFDADGAVTLVPTGDETRARVGAALITVPLSDSDLSPCWRAEEVVECCGCAPADATEAGTCACAITLKPARA